MIQAMFKGEAAIFVGVFILLTLVGTFCVWLLTITASCGVLGG